jgi:hypothetical protein
MPQRKVKVKLFATRHGGAWGERRYSSCSYFTSATRWGWVVSVTPRPRFTPGERTPGTHWTGGWVGLRAGLGAEARRKILCPSRGSNLDHPTVQPVVRHYTAWATATGHERTWTRHRDPEDTIKKCSGTLLPAGLSAVTQRFFKRRLTPERVRKRLKPFSRCTLSAGTEASQAQTETWIQVPRITAGYNKCSWAPSYRLFSTGCSELQYQSL